MSSQDVVVSRYKSLVKDLVFCFGLSALALFLCSKDSPLYIRSDWSDVNIFMTMARGMREGKVVYRDLYDQKGPLLYLVYYLLSFLSYDHWPVYLFEVFTYGLFVYYSYKIVCLYITERQFVFVLACVPVVTKGFFMGGSPEEMVLCLFMIPMYWVLKSLKFDVWLLGRQVFFIGLFCGVCFWVKYTFCGFFLGACIFVLYYKYKTGVWRDVLLFLSGFLSVSLFVFVYCLDQNCLFDMLHAYFYDNLIVYPDNSCDTQFFERMFFNLGTLIVNHLPAVVAWCFLILYSLIYKTYLKSKAFWFLTCTWVGLFLSTIIMGTSFIYYGFVFNAYLFAGCVCFAKIFGDLLNKYRVGLFIKIALLSGLLLFNKNIYYLKYSDGLDPQSQFAEIIKSEMGDKRPYVLQYMFLDIGFLNACDAYIPEPYFCMTNMRLPEMFEFQNKCLENGLADYVITVDHSLAFYDDQIDISKYELKKKIVTNYWYLIEDCGYYLYKRCDVS